MRSRRGPLLAVVAAVLILVVVVSLVLIALAPVLFVVELAVIALVAGLASRLRRPSRHRTRRSGQPRTGDAPHPDRDEGTGSSTAPRWTMKWQSTPPPSAVRFAREQLTRVLAEWDLTGEAVEPTLLVVTELLSNAIDHARAPIQLAVSRTGESVRVELRDSVTEPPRLQPHDPWAKRGRGLQVVEALSSRWGWTNEPAGKTVWADVLTEWPL
jgi:anti-sigma regulatory factor (Ser/Thr protein kinase)